MWRRSSVTGLIGRLSDKVARTAGQLKSRARDPAAIVDGLSATRRRQLVEELGYALGDRPARHDPIPAPEPDAERTRAAAEHPVTVAADVDATDPPFIGVPELEAMDPPPPRGDLLLGPQREGPVYAVAERVFDAAWDGPVQRLAIEEGAADAPDGPIGLPAIVVEEEETVDGPEPHTDPFERYDHGPA